MLVSSIHNINKRTIRRAKVEDIKTIIEILNENKLSHLQQQNMSSLDARGFLIKGYSEEYLTNLILDLYKNINLIAIEKNKIIGYLLSYQLNDNASSWLNDIDNSAHYKNILAHKKILFHQQIAKRSQYKNVGKDLIEALFTQARNKGFKYILCKIVHAPVLNSISIAFHQKFGFEFIGMLKESEYAVGVYLKKV